MWLLMTAQIKCYTTQTDTLDFVCAVGLPKQNIFTECSYFSVIFHLFN